MSDYADHLGTETFVSSQHEHPLPPIGFGTYQLPGIKCFESVKHAIENGYRHIDTAMAYDNESAVGRAIATSPVDRENLFVTTKIKGYPEYVTYNRILDETDGCLQRLGTEYIDLLLIHWWNSESDMEETFSALDDLVDEGIVRHIGVSNFSIDRLSRALAVADHPILTNQIEYHPYWTQPELLDFCRSHDVVITAYSPLAEGKLIHDPVLATIGESYNKSAAQIAIRWLIQQEGIVTIPRSTSLQHMRENIDVFDFTLTDAEMDRINSLKGPWWYRHNREGGFVYTLRGIVGPVVNTVTPGSQ